MAMPRTLMKVTAAADTIGMPFPPRSAVTRPAMAEAMRAPTTNAVKQSERCAMA